MNETPFYFPNGRTSLFGIMHRPQVSAPRSPFVFCHPFGEEKLWTHRVYVSFARLLAEAGHPVLRFDLTGNGDSQGAFSETSLATALADVRCAIAQVRSLTGAETVNLLGLRLGATLAAIVAEAETGIGDLILWSPIVDGGRYMQELLRINLTTQMAIYKEVRQDREALVAAMQEGSAINVDGYDMTYPLYAEVSAVKLASEPKRHARRSLIVQVDRQPNAPPSAETQQLSQCYRDATVRTVQEEPFWKEIQRFYDTAPNLFPATMAWLTP